LVHPELDPNITIRILHTSQEMHDAVQIQRVYWGDDMGDMVPLHMMMSISHYGGHIFGAYDGDKLVGILIGFLGADVKPDDNLDARQRLLIMSKRMVVLPEYRGRKIGESLKLAQRDYALRHNIPLVSWTFDPMLSRNAYLNIHKLRGVVQKYIPDFFGKEVANPALQADRVSLSWWVAHSRLTQDVLPDMSSAPILNPTKLQNGLRVLNGSENNLQESAYRLEIPSEFVPYERLDTQLAQDWRLHIRHHFQRLLSSGYLASDFVRIDERSFYVFARDDGTYRFETQNMTVMQTQGEIALQ
jgi:chorismate synthase